MGTELHFGPKFIITKYVDLITFRNDENYIEMHF